MTFIVCGAHFIAARKYVSNMWVIFLRKSKHTGTLIIDTLMIRYEFNVIFIITIPIINVAMKHTKGEATPYYFMPAISAKSSADAH